MSNDIREAAMEMLETESKEAFELLKVTWPFNFASKCFKETSIDVCDVPISDIFKAMDHLTPRELRVILLKYKDNITLSDITNMIGVSHTRIYQIDKKAQRKFRFTYQHMVTKRRDNIAEFLYSSFKEKYGVEEPHDDGAPEVETFYIEDLELSVRSYNCLRRCFLKLRNDTTYKATVNDILELSFAELYAIRNLGRRSIEEILSRLKVYADSGRFSPLLEGMVRDKLEVWEAEAIERGLGYIFDFLNP